MAPSGKITYTDTGVDRGERAAAKERLADLRRTYIFSKLGEPLKLPYGMITPMGNGRYADIVIEGVGTKVLVAQLAEKYDTIGIDGIAMAYNDVKRSGADCAAFADNIDMQRSEPWLVGELLKGLVEGAMQARAPLISGETADVPALTKGIRKNKGFHVVVTAVGELYEEYIIRGNDLVPGDVVIGLRSSGMHSNGYSLGRRVLFKKWGGAYLPSDVADGLERSVVEEALEPTRIYAKQLGTVDTRLVKALVHITGDAYLKFDKLQEVNPGIGFEFNNFDPHPIFGVIQGAARRLGKEIDDEEMFRTFNMGWGYAVVTGRQNANAVIDAMGEGEPIGRVTNTGGIVVRYRRKILDLKR